MGRHASRPPWPQPTTTRSDEKAKTETNAEAPATETPNVPHVCRYCGRAYRFLTTHESKCASRLDQQ